MHVGVDATLHVEGSDTVATFDGVEVFNEGTIQVDNNEQPTTLIGTDGTTITGGTLSIGTSGLVEAEAGTNALGLALDNVTVWNCGTLEANGTTLYVASTSTINGNGNVLIAGDGIAHFAGEFQQDVTFHGAGTLALDDSLACGGYAGLITGFAARDAIDLNDIAYSSGEYAVWTQVTTGSEAAGTLQLYNSDQVLQETLNFAGSYTQSQFALSDDGTAAHGTSVDFHYLSFFNGQTNFSDNGHVGYTGPQISTDGSAITLTNDLQGEAGSWFGSNTHAITSFTASFDYLADGQADGLAFILQNDPSGTQALGDSGSGLGYTGISPSAAVEFNFYNGHVQGTNFETDGTTQTYNPTGDVTLGNGDNLQVVLSYDGHILTETLTDLTNGATYSTSYTGIDLSEIVGSDSAYIGFSAATGLFSSTQTVSNFNFESGDAVYWDGECNNWTAADVWTDRNENTVSMPDAASNVFVDEEGSYRITINSADVANFLTITCDGAGADIQDETGGSLTLNGSLTIDAGKFSLIGGALSAASIYVGANGHFIGYGDVAAPLDNDGGFVEAQQNQTLSLLAPVTGDGCFHIANDAVLEFGGSVAGGTVTFGSECGMLKIDQPSSFHGEISGSLSSGDVIDLRGLNTQVGDTITATPVSEDGVTTLTVSDTTRGTSASLTFVGENFAESEWNVSADGSGGVYVTDPPAPNPAANPSVASTATVNSASGTVTFAENDADTLTASVTPQGSDYVGTFTLDPLTKSNGAGSLGFHFDLGSDQINLAPGQTLTQSYGISVTDAQNPGMNVTQTVAVTIGGAGNDNFVFHPGVGADTIVNFDPTHDTIELDHFANAQTVQQLESLITSDAHGDAVIALGHHDSITVANVTAAQVQQLAQSGHVLMH